MVYKNSQILYLYKWWEMWNLHGIGAHLVEWNKMGKHIPDDFTYLWYTENIISWWKITNENKLLSFHVNMRLSSNCGEAAV